MKRIFTVYSLVIGWVFNLVFVLMFYLMLFNGNARIIVDANSIGEYWLEFFLIQFTLVFIFVVFISEMRRWLKPAS